MPSEPIVVTLLVTILLGNQMSALTAQLPVFSVQSSVEAKY